MTENENRITILGRIPSKKNSKIMVCRGKFPILLPSEKYMEWHKDASYQLKGKPKISKGKLELNFYFPDNRKTDLTNKAESALDLLVDNGLIEDDNWTVVNDLRLVSMGVDKINPRVEIVW